MELVDESARRRGQVAAMPDELVPEASGRGLERQWTKRVADLSHQHRQMGFKPPPITPDQLTPTRYLRRSLAVKPLGDGRCVDRPVRLGKLRQATDADVTVPAEKAPDPNPQHQRGRGADIPMVITQRFQGQGTAAIGAVLRRRDLILII